jgi:TatA/E family protein of Tat protein translocase
MGGLGMPEIMIILVIALIVFGPRKLPDLGRSLGKAMGQFRRASEDFKRTWEQEVEIEKTRTSLTATSEVGSSDASYDPDYHANSYDPYNSDYGYNAPSDADVAASDTAATADASEAATAEVAATATPTNKPQPGQWI